MAVDSSYLSHWLNLAGMTSHHSLFITPENEFVKTLEGELKSLIPTTSVVLSEMDLKDSIQPYSDNSAEVAVFLSKTPLFDLYTFIAVLVYLVIFYVVVMIVHDVRIKE